MHWTQIGEQCLVGDEQGDSVNVNLEFDLVSLTSKSAICYRIRTVNSKGKSEPSRLVELHPENFIPGKPDQLEAPVIKSDSIKITWKEPKNNPIVVTDYQIQYKMTTEATMVSRKT